MQKCSECAANAFFDRIGTRTAGYPPGPLVRYGRCTRGHSLKIVGKREKAVISAHPLPCLICTKVEVLVYGGSGLNTICESCQTVHC